ncbi:MAG: LysR family transcriptional regulator [Clostridia bacterium]|nr:LysR family transcriptional regulator [Clostridia bacterium]
MLEKRMEVALFLRLPRGIRLTDEGKILFRHIEPAFNMIKAGEKRIEETKALDSGEVFISASDTICMYFLPPYLERFKELHPGISLRIANKTTHETISLLKKGESGLGVINLDGELPVNMTIWKKSELNNCFIAKKGSLAINGAEYSPADIAKMPLMMLEKGTSTREAMDQYFAMDGIEAAPSIELGSIELLIRFSALGIGISCVAREYLEKSGYRDMVDILPVARRINKRHIGVVTLNGIPISRATEAFLDVLSEEK